MSTLTTRVIISKNIKMDREYKHVLNFTEASMLALVRSQGHLVNEISNASFINETGHIYVPFTYSECLQSNYIAFQNPTYSNKWFFAFIDDVKFHSKNMQEISYTVDVWSTWFSYLTVKPCFVVREHTNDDTIGANTIEENLDVGKVHSYYNASVFDVTSKFFIVISCTYNVLEDKDFWGVSFYNKNVFGYQLFLFEIDTTNATSMGNALEGLTRFLGKIQEKKSSTDCINDIFIVPTDMIPQNKLHLNNFEPDGAQGATYLVYTLLYSVDADEKVVFMLNGDSTPSGMYEPVNNKCYCYPYNYLYVTNNCGNDNIYRYEDFITHTHEMIEQLEFIVQASISTGYSASLIPIDYKGVNVNYNESIPLGKYPVCGWASDSYTNWLTQNSVNLPLKVVESVLGNTGSLITSSGQNYSVRASAKNESARGMANILNSNLEFSGSSGGITQGQVINAGVNLGVTVLETIGAFKNAKLLPNVSQGGNNGNLNFANNTLKFTFYQMRATDENLKIIDDYFTMFGYKTNRIKIPNITGRRNFNYIEISKNDCLGFGNIPSMALDVINAVAQRGLTIWHNHANLGDYTVQNDII